MQTNPNSPFSDTQTQRGVYVADGHGAKLYVHHGHLIIEDGAGRQRRTRRLHKATADIQRIVFLARSGFLTVDAVRWLTDAGIGLIHLDPNGQLLTSTAPPSGHDPQLRRAQALAASTPIGIDITRSIINDKIVAQLEVASQIADGATCETIAEKLEELAKVQTLERIRLVEAQAAASYWSAWASTPLQFVNADLDRIPDHWRRVGPRHSPITKSSREAANPAQAILNYLYALLEGEARIACATAGLDPAIGILHADQPYRDSLALDVMEPARPKVDRYVLDLIQGHHFRRIDFYENRRGSCRINRQLAHTLAGTTGTWRVEVAPTVEGVARTLRGERRTSRGRVPTRLTHANRQAGRNNQRRRQSNTQPGVKTTPRPANRCIDCGTTIPASSKRCAPCNAPHRDIRATTLADISWDQRRREQHDPAHGGEAARKRGAKNRQGQLAANEWDRNNPIPDPESFVREILPGLQSVTVRAMAEATGLSSGYCSMIKRGIKTPHPRHWTVLAALTRDSNSDPESRAAGITSR